MLSRAYRICTRVNLFQLGTLNFKGYLKSRKWDEAQKPPPPPRVSAVRVVCGGGAPFSGDHDSAAWRRHTLLISILILCRRKLCWWCRGNTKSPFHSGWDRQQHIFYFCGSHFIASHSANNTLYSLQPWIIKLKYVWMTTVRTKKIWISTTNLALQLIFQHNNDNISHIHLAKILSEVLPVGPSIYEPTNILLVRTEAASDAICSHAQLCYCPCIQATSENQGVYVPPHCSRGRYASFTRLLLDLLLLVDLLRHTPNKFGGGKRMLHVEWCQHFVPILRPHYCRRGPTEAKTGKSSRTPNHISV